MGKCFLDYEPRKGKWQGMGLENKGKMETNQTNNLEKMLTDPQAWL